jgi:phosphatidylglycerophosphate synthase
VLAQHRIVPLAPVAALFVRELAVTRLRGIALEEKFSLPTSRLAKLKTSAQMAGGRLPPAHLDPSPRAPHPALLFAMRAGAALAPVLAYLRGRTPGWRAWWGMGLIAWSPSGARWASAASCKP